MTMVAQSATALIANLSHHGRFGRRWSFHVESLIVSISEPLSNPSCQIPPPSTRNLADFCRRLVLQSDGKNRLE